jgi:peptidoglycan/LPS O-acetylase OafA/YrhL
VPSPTTPILFAVTLAATTAIAAVSYYVVELPFLRRKEPRRAGGPAATRAGVRHLGVRGRRRFSGLRAPRRGLAAPAPVLRARQPPAEAEAPEETAVADGLSGRPG